ncbi:MAG TPA: DNA topoisomerase IV [Crocinitomix sp.]|nr:DNA topoisomerase IV [Crocinitomix sp.]
MKYLYVFLLASIISCNNPSNLKPNQLRIGTFKTFIKDGNYESLATRNDSIQIETFDKKKDTFYIKWKSNFEYILLKKNPKNDLDKKEFIVKITGVKQNSYTFTAYFKGSNYKQKGKAIKIN